MASKENRRNFEQKRDDILACAPDHILHCGSHTLYEMARHLDVSHTGLRHYIPSVDELIRLVCRRHLNDMFDAVCLPADWPGTPLEVLRAMGLALLDYADENASRHLVFLLHRQGLCEPVRSANDTMLTYLTNNFQLALQAVCPDKPFEALHSPARLFLGQILHLPLWWPTEAHISKEAWLAHQIGQVG